MRRRVANFAGILLAVVLCLMTATPVFAAPGDVGTWATSPNSLPGIITAPGFVTYNGYGYTLGGFNNDPWSDDVYYTKLNSDGTVDAWSTNANPIPHIIGYPSAAAYNGKMYVMGGYGSGLQNKVYYATINNDGSIGTWTTSPNDLPSGIYESAVVAANDRLYLFGGTTGSGTSDAIYTAPINNDGSVGTWTTSPSTLPTELTRAAFGYSNGWVYLAGGATNSTNYSAGVYYAKLNSDGSIGTWTTSPNSLPVGTNGPAGIATGGYFYVLGGNITNSSTRTDAVYSAKINSDGSIGTWTTSPNSLPAPRQHPAVFAANSYLYVAGGQNGPALSTVFSAFAEPAPDPVPETSPASSAAPATSLAETGDNSSVIAGLAVITFLASATVLLRKMAHR